MRNTKRWVALLLATVMTFVDVMPVGAVEAESEDYEVAEDVVLDETDEFPEIVLESNGAKLVILEEITEEREITDGDDIAEISEESDSETVEEAEVEDVSDEEIFEICGLPEDEYELCEEQIKEKSDMSEMMDDFDKAIAGEDYVEDNVFFMADTEEEAMAVIEAIGGELINFEYGVAVAKINEKLTVEDVVLASSDMEMNLPAMYPDYYGQVYDVEDYSDDSEYYYDIDNNALTGVGQNYDPYTYGTSECYQWHHDVIGSKYAWDLGYTGKGVTVAVLDTGIVSSNSDIAYDSTKSVSCVKNCAVEDPVGEYYSNHGTHVAGIIAGKKNGSEGQGVAPDATIQVVRVMNPMGYITDNNGDVPEYKDCTVLTDSSVVMGLKYVSTSGAEVVNMSLGHIRNNTAYNGILTELYNKGIVVVAAAGNENTSDYKYPAASDHVITVAATNKDNTRTVFSNYGDWMDVCAPGSGIYSTVGDGYEAYDGTSMASPVIAGEIAVILSAANDIPELKGKTGSAKVDAVESILKNNTIISPDKKMGAGIPSLSKIFNLNENGEIPVAPTIYTNIAANKQYVKFDVSTQNLNTLRYTLDGTDPRTSATAEIVDSTSKSITAYANEKLKDPGKIDLSVVAVSSTGTMGEVGKSTVILKPWVSSITLTGPGKIAKGKGVTYKAEVAPSYASIKGIEWTAEYIGADEGHPVSPVIITAANAEYYGVSMKGGKFSTKPNARGVFNIKVKAIDGSNVFAEKKVVIIDADTLKDVKFTAKAVKVPRQSENVDFDLSPYLDANMLNGGKAGVDDFTWTSSKVNFVKIKENGIVTCVAPGKATITATSADSSGKKATINVEVVQLATGINIVSTPVNMGETHIVSASKNLALKAEVVPSNASNKAVNWRLFTEDGTEVTKSNAAIYGVSISNGKIAAKPGSNGQFTARAYAKDEGGAFASYTVKVIPNKVTSLAVRKDSVKVDIFRVSGRTDAPTEKILYFDVKGDNCNDKNLYNAISSNPSIATASVESVSSGVAEVKVKSKGTKTGKVTVSLCAVEGSGKKATSNVTVSNPASGLALTTTKCINNRVIVGKSIDIKALFATEFGPVTNKNLEWSVDGYYSYYAKISSTGKLTVSKSFPKSKMSKQDRLLTVTAKTTDGTNIVATTDVYVVACELRKVQLLSYDSWPIPTRAMCVFNSRGNNDVVYIFVGVSNVYYSTSYDGFNITASCSDPSILTTGIGVAYNRYYGMMNTLELYPTGKKGEVKITITAQNGGVEKSVTYRAKVI